MHLACPQPGYLMVPGKVSIRLCTHGAMQVAFIIGQQKCSTTMLYQVRIGRCTLDGQTTPLAQLEQQGLMLGTQHGPSTHAQVISLHSEIRPHEPKYSHTYNNSVKSVIAKKEPHFFDHVGGWYLGRGEGGPLRGSGLRPAAECLLWKKDPQFCHHVGGSLRATCIQPASSWRATAGGRKCAVSMLQGTGR